MLTVQSTQPGDYTQIVTQDLEMYIEIEEELEFTGEMETNLVFKYPVELICGLQCGSPNLVLDRIWSVDVFAVCRLMFIILDGNICYLIYFISFMEILWVLLKGRGD